MPAWQIKSSPTPNPLTLASSVLPPARRLTPAGITHNLPGDPEVCVTKAFASGYKVTAVTVTV